MRILITTIAILCFVTNAGAQVVDLLPQNRRELVLMDDGTIVQRADCIIRQGTISRIYRSTDSGHTWEVDHAPSLVRSVRQLQSDGINLFTWSEEDSVVITSQDNGDTWSMLPELPSRPPGGQNYKVVARAGAPLIVSSSAAVWLLNEGTMTWSDPITLPGPSFVMFGYDGILYSQDSRDTIRWYDAPTSSWIEVNLPAYGDPSETVNYSLANKWIFAASGDMRRAAILEYGKWIDVINNPGYYGQIPFSVDDRATFTNHGWYRRETPEVRNPYLTHDGMELTAYDVDGSPRTLVVQDRTFGYVSDNWDSVVLSERWLLDPVAGSSYDGLGIVLTSDDRIVAQWTLDKRKTVSAFSKDGGASWYCGTVDTLCRFFDGYSQGAHSGLITTQDGSCILYADQDCTYLSQDNGNTFKTIYGLHESYVRHPIPHEDGSVTYSAKVPFTNIFTIYRQETPTEKAWEIPSFQSEKHTWTYLDANHAARMGPDANDLRDNLFVSYDRGVSSQSVWISPKARDGWWTRMIYLSDQELAIIVRYVREPRVNDTSYVYLYNVQQNTVRYQYFGTTIVNDVARRPNGQLVFVLSDFRVLLFDENDASPTILQPESLADLDLAHRAFTSTIVASDSLIIIAVGDRAPLLRVKGSNWKTSTVEDAAEDHAIAQLRVVPNPAHNEFKVLYEDGDFLHGGRMHIYNMNGVEVLATDFHGQDHQTDLPSGMYTLSIRKGTASVSTLLTIVK